MGIFPIIGKKLGHKIPYLGYFWETVFSQDPINGFYMGKMLAYF